MSLQVPCTRYSPMAGIHFSYRISFDPITCSLYSWLKLGNFFRPTVASLSMMKWRSINKHVVFGISPVNIFLYFLVSYYRQACVLSCCFYWLIPNSLGYSALRVTAEATTSYFSFSGVPSFDSGCLTSTSPFWLTALSAWAEALSSEFSCGSSSLASSSSSSCPGS